MEKWGIILQLLAGIVLGLDYFVKREKLDEINTKISKKLSWFSGKPGRAIGVSLLAALSLASLGVASLIMIFGGANISSWEDILGNIVGAIFLVGFGGIAYGHSLKFISEKIKEKRISRHKGKRGIIEGDVLKANLLLLLIILLVGGILILVSFILAELIPLLLVVSIFICIFLVPAFIGSVSYLIVRFIIKILDKLSEMPKGALGPVALGLFVTGGILRLIEIW